MLGNETGRILRNVVSRGFCIPKGGFGIVAPSITLDSQRERQGQQFVADLFKGHEITVVSFGELAASHEFDAVRNTRRIAENKPPEYLGAVLLGEAADSGLFDNTTLNLVPNLETLMLEDQGTFVTLFESMHSITDRVKEGKTVYADLIQSKDSAVRLTGTAAFFMML